MGLLICNLMVCSTSGTIHSSTMILGRTEYVVQDDYSVCPRCSEGVNTGSIVGVEFSEPYLTQMSHVLRFMKCPYL